MASQFNEDQELAILTKNKNILVSAPAGSGKTKILVSRMMEHILNDGYEVDEFLVVTFTQAAALEMKQRLLLELDKYPELSKQKEKLPYAYITNFHGFCSTLLKQYGNMIGVNQDFEILEDATKLKKQAFDICIHKWIQDEGFKNFLNLYYPGNFLDSFYTQLNHFCESEHQIEHFYDFINNKLKNYYQIESMSDWPMLEVMRQLFIEAVEESYERFDELMDVVSGVGLEDFYSRPLEQGKAASKQMVPSESIALYLETKEKALKVDKLLYETFRSDMLAQPEKAYNIKWEGYEDYKDEITKLRSSVLKPIKDLSEQLFSNDMKLLLDMSVPFFLMFTNLLHDYLEVFKQLKRERNYLDFNDLESEATRLLGRDLPISQLLNKKLKEIMIDEYQDTNQVQENLIHLISDFDDHQVYCFMVGDMKQAIYRFRNADPILFMNKYNTFNHLEDSTRIDLHYNYRSNKIVLDSINYIFNALMDTKVGAIDYYHDDNSQLNYDFLRKEKVSKEEAIKRLDQEQRFDTELLLYDKASIGTKDDIEYEAHLVAKRIQEFIQNGSLDNYSFQARKVDYKDIVVLMRSTTSILTFKKVFDLYHIPNHIVLSTGMFSSVEIQSMITLIQAILNPYDNVKMLSVLRNNFAFSHFDEQVLYSIKSDNIYKTILSDERFKDFNEVFTLLIDSSLNKSPADFIEDVFAYSKFDHYELGLINGKQRKANLDLFYQYILEHNDLSIHEIMQDLSERIDQGYDASPAVVVSSNDNVVQFMTIHKSKGLEFPIVFVCNMDKGMNKEDSKSNVFIHNEYGMAVKPRTYKNVDDIENIIVEYDNPYRRILSKLTIKDALDEEMRILYVALTRASQKLVMTGGTTVDDLNKYQKLVSKSNDMIFKRKDRIVKSYLDWVLPVYLTHPNIQDFSYADFKVAPYKGINRFYKENVQHAKLSMKMYSKETIDKLNKETDLFFIEDKYPQVKVCVNAEEEPIQKTIAVTSLVDEVSYSKAKRIQKMPANEFGTLVHLFFEHTLFTNPYDDIISLYEQGLYDEECKEALLGYIDKLEGFYQSDAVKIMKTSKMLFKEKTFSYLLNQDQVLHGTIDVLCFDDDLITIIDYKTDRVLANESDEVLYSIHLVQMNYYLEMMKKMYPDKQAQAIVYYLEINKAITIK